MEFVKKNALIFSFLVLMLFAKVDVYSQIPFPVVVFDSKLNKQLAEQVKTNSLKVNYETIKTAISKGALKEAFVITKQVTNQYSLLNEVYGSASGITNLRKYRVFYEKANSLNNTIGQMSGYLATKSDKELSRDYRKTITKGLLSAVSEVGLATELVSFSMNSSNSLSTKERLDQIDEATGHLETANKNLSVGYSIIQAVEAEKAFYIRSNQYHKLKYNIQ